MTRLPLVGPESSSPRRPLSGQLSAPMRRFLGTEAGGAALALAGVLVAVAWANSPWADAYRGALDTRIALSVGGTAWGMSVHDWVNDGLMTLFFFVVGLEVRRELALGELTDRRRVVVPMVAALCGAAVPALLFLAVVGRGAAGPGWGAVVGTDTAFVLGALAVVGPRASTQLRLFLLTMSVVDDIVAVSVIGVAYTGRVDLRAVAAALACLVVLGALARAGVWQGTPYLVVLTGLWAATVASGLHPSIAGMLAGLLVAAAAPGRDAVEGAARLVRAFRQSPMASVGRSARRGLVRAVPVNDRLQELLHPWTAYLVVPVFALANAGVVLRGGAWGDALRSPLTWGVVLALVVGKLVGVGGGTWLAVRTGLGRLPRGVGPGSLAGGAALSGIGFTISLLVVGLAFDDARLRDEAAIGVLAAGVLATALGALVFRLAAALLGERSADLPSTLAVPVDPARDHIRGPADAPVTLVEYLDFECPFCAKATGVAKELRLHFGDELRHVVRHLPLPDVHPHAELAAMAAEAAGRQGRFWPMHDLLFAHQDRLERENLVGYAGELGLDVDAFVADLTDPGLAAHVRADVEGAEASGARGTPTFFVGGHRHEGPHDATSLVAALTRAGAGTP
ncbi:Na+/H+ antiporter NhaA [Isoptericola sp. b441]|uniref:Na(+)/H(+) antiporter NhaA n=1 Tax=Actinotalea lenta TaxID=3064654 RepID=A0ABT9D812_9CELL|nr:MULTISPECIES: Na+/H+ antiporter NhaA [unclassified Isoptericola]MDO8107015.1 Na+/H+ antiporter NhaA [Isoptericola sp. b441]MDO8121275.1 Na+/H+ antiporter NhaA [Isoptericola sp. b490]